MVIATFIASDRAGEHISYDGDRGFAIVDGEALSATQILDFDRHRLLSWNSADNKRLTWAIASLEKGDRPTKAARDRRRVGTLERAVAFTSSGSGSRPPRGNGRLPRDHQRCDCDVARESATGVQQAELVVTEQRRLLVRLLLPLRLLERLTHMPQRRAVDPLAAEQISDGEQLQPRMLAPRRRVETR